METPSPLTVEFRDARTNSAFVNRYLTEVLQPGVAHPAEGAFLYNADYDFLSDAGAIIGICWVGDQAAAGLYITVDDTNLAWINGVRVGERFRRLGYGAVMARESLAYISDYLRLDRCALTVFCNDMGIPNKAAFDLYQECGFRQVKPLYPVTVAGSLRDRHLPGTERLAVRMEAWAQTRISESRNKEARSENNSAPGRRRAEIRST